MENLRNHDKIRTRRFHIFSLIFYFVLSTPATLASDTPPVSELRYNCLSRHIEEAYHLNSERLPLYASLTHGKSIQISRTLLLFEKFGTYGAIYFDWIARSYQKKGIPVLCNEIASMDTVPEFKNEQPFSTPPPQHFKKVNVKQLKEDIREAYTKYGFEGVRRYTYAKLIELNATPPFHCMLRHLLESILRTSELAPQYMELAQAQGLHSTQWISWSFIWTHLLLLPEAYKLDQAAFPIQQQGIPIICQDIPTLF